MKLTIVYKLVISVVILVLLSTGVIGWLFYSKTTELLVEQSAEDIANLSRNAGSRLQEHINDQRKDAIFLSESPPIQGLLRAIKYGNEDVKGKSSYSDWEKRLQSIFVSMIKNKSAYSKIRFLDKKGQELISVIREEKKIKIRKKENLQNISHRLYFSEALKLPVGVVYLSEINLNREHGKISIPHKEVLQSATPVYDDETGEVAGVLVVTVNVGRELREIQRIVQDAKSRIFITNDRGGYLLHPDKRKTYGFDLGKRYRIQEDIPKLSKLFLPENNNRKYIILPKGGKNKHVVNFIKIPFDKEKPDRFIAIGVSKLYTDILDTEKDVLNVVMRKAWVFVVIVVLLAVIGAYRLARPIRQIREVMDSYTHDRKTNVIMPVHLNDEIGVLARSYNSLIEQVDKAKNDLKGVNLNLEAIVNDRTRDLEISEERQRAIVEHMVDPLITINDLGIVSLFNPAAERVFGYQKEEVIGNNVKMLMPEPYHTQHDGYLKNYSNTGNRKIIGFGREITALRKDGSVFPADLSVSEMMVDGKKLYTGVIRDITERKQIDKMKNEFISTVSHELRTPLTAIRGSLSLINGGVVGPMPDAAQEMLEIAGNNTERLLMLINDILDIQKIESGQMSFKFKDVELISFLKQAIEAHQSYGEEYGVGFVVESELSEAHVFADSNRLMQVVANLLSNAAKFSPKGDTVTLTVAELDNIIRMSVTDNGHGIPKEFHSKLFDKFTQSDSSDTRQKGGTGLGLNITKAIVKKHGGRINFITTEGVGTTFVVDFPGLVCEVNNTPSPPTCLYDENVKSILVIADNPEVSGLLRRILTEAGFNSEVAPDMSQALVKLNENSESYIAITFDPGIHGNQCVDLFNKLNEKVVSRQIPVILVSAKPDMEKHVLYGGAVGVTDWMQKPIDSDRLIKVVKRVAVAGNGKPRILHVEDDVDVCKVVSLVLGDFDLIKADTLDLSRELLKKDKFDLVLLDIGLPDGSGLDLLKMIEEMANPPAVLIFSAYDVENKYAEKVSAVLVESKTDNHKLAETVKHIVRL